MDMLNPKVEEEVRGWICVGRVWCVWSGTPCAKWTGARTTGKRGGATDFAGLGCAWATVRLVDACNKGGVYHVIESPASSKLFKWKPLLRGIT